MPDNGGPQIANTVSDIARGRVDGRGERIDYVYFKRQQYAIYLSRSQIVVQYADNINLADQQIATVSPLLPLRDHLTNIIKDFPPSSVRENYFAQIAEALRSGLENQLDVAKAIIADAVQDALDVQARIGRMIYLKWAACIALVVGLLLVGIGGSYVQGQTGVHLLLMATGAGAIGALLSIAIAIRNRSVAVAGDWKANAMDAAVRLLIGIISAGVFFLLLNSGMLTDVQVGAAKFSGANAQWQAVLLVGFVAGFLERLVPDLLDSGGAAANAQPKPPPATGRGIATPDPDRN